MSPCTCFRGGVVALECRPLPPGRRPAAPQTNRQVARSKRRRHRGQSFPGSRLPDISKLEKPSLDVKSRVQPSERAYQLSVAAGAVHHSHGRINSLKEDLDYN